MEEHDDLLDPDYKGSTINNASNEEDLPNAIATLVLGILSIIGCFLYGLPGLILGIIGLSLHGKDKRLYTENPDKYAASFKNARAGYICAIIGTSLSAVVFVIFFFVFFMAITTSRPPF